MRERAKPYAGDGHFELYKTSIKFDNPEARLAHEFPTDMESVEVKQMVYATQNSGRPYPAGVTIAIANMQAILRFQIESQILKAPKGRTTRF